MVPCNRHTGHLADHGLGKVITKTLMDSFCRARVSYDRDEDLRQLGHFTLPELGERGGNRGTVQK
jgi:hypothetical protein